MKLTTLPSFQVPTAAPRTEVRLSGTELSRNLDKTALTEENADDIVVLSPADGSFRLEPESSQPRSSEAEKVLPLRFGPLQKAFDTIEEKQGWLMAQPPVIKIESGGDTRIDFINFGGFVFDPQGNYQSHSVNPW